MGDSLIRPRFSLNTLSLCCDYIPDLRQTLSRSVVASCMIGIFMLSKKYVCGNYLVLCA